MMTKSGLKDRSVSKKRITCWILSIFLLALASYGCGGGSNDENSPPYAIEKVELRLHSFENPTQNTYYQFSEITNNGGPIQETDVTNVAVTNSGGFSVFSTNDGFFNTNYYLYDCMGGSCSQTGPRELAGMYALYDTLPIDDYRIDFDMENDQVLSSDIDFLRQLNLPVVSTATMSASYQPSGDLELNWDNPSSALNWGQVDQLRVVIFDGTSGSEAVVLYIALLPTDPDTVTIPAALVADLLLLGNGTLDRWNIQTRAYDANGMNDARGYSNSVSLPVP